MKNVVILCLFVCWQDLVERNCIVKRFKWLNGIGTKQCTARRRRKIQKIYFLVSKLSWYKICIIVRTSNTALADEAQNSLNFPCTTSQYTRSIGLDTVRQLFCSCKTILQSCRFDRILIIWNVFPDYFFMQFFINNKHDTVPGVQDTLYCQNIYELTSFKRHNINMHNCKG